MTEFRVAVDARLVSGTSTGDSTYWTELLRAMATLNPSPKLLLFSNQERPEKIPWNEEWQWRTVSARSSRLWSLISFPLAARKAGARAIHTQYSVSPLVGRGGVSTIHDVSFMIGPEWFKPRDRALLRLGVGTACRRAASIITVSKTSKGEIEQYFPASKGKVEAIYNAAPSWIYPVEGARERVAAKFGLPQGFLLTVGTRWPRKNMELAIDALAAIPAVSRPTLALTGKFGWGENRAPEGVQTLGYVSEGDLRDLYSSASLYLAPSRHEGFGIPVLEAFTCGCPVICSNGGALPEVASDAALVMGSGRPGDWAEAIQGLLADSSKLEELRARGRKRAQEFSWTEAAKRTAEIYQRVCEK